MARPRWRRLLAGAAAGLTLATALAALSLDFQRFPPEGYRGLAEILDTPTAVVQHLLGITYGPVRLDLAFPSDRSGQREPLVATGTAEAGDLVYVEYLAGGRIRIGVVGVGVAGPVSAPVSLRPGERHQVEISIGSLYPAAGHPLLRRLSEPQIAFLKRRVRIAVDGSTVLDARAHFYPSSPRDVVVGAAPALPDYAAPAFTGRIFAVRRRPVTPPSDPALIQPARFGALHLTVRFPRDKSGTQEPLLVTGVPQAGDVVYVEYGAKGLIRLGFDHWGHPGIRTNWLPVDFAVDHDLEILIGSLLPSPIESGPDNLTLAGFRRQKDRVRISLDGQTVLEARQDTYESSPYDVVVGQNVIGASTCGYAFTGEIREVKRVPPPAPTGP